MNEVKRETHSTTNLATTTALTAKTKKVKNEIPNITNLSIITALAAVENKISSASNLFKKTDYNTKINETEKKISDHDHDKYITTPECNKLAVENLPATLAQPNLGSKSDIANFV